MSSDEIAINIQGLSKCHQIYNVPGDRLKQFIVPRLQRMLWRQPKQYYREFWALKDASFKVKKGETVGIIGRNGSGKSTLLQLICGTLSATSGIVETNGRIAALLELGAGFNKEFTGRENVFLNAAILGIKKDLMAERFDKVAEFAGLGDHINQPMKTYSSGMYARLAFAAAIHVDPEILIVDEALAVGDAGFQLKCMLRMREMQEQGVTILFVSHDMASVTRLCDRAIVIEQGKLLPGDQNPLKSVKLYEQLTRNTSIQSKKSFSSDKQSKSYKNELKGIDETRFGSQEAEYLSIQFFSENGEEKEVFEAGEEIEIRALIKSSRDFSKVISGFTLKNKAGVDVWGDNTLFADYDLSLSIGLTSLSYQFTLSLREGEYFLYIGLADISGERIELDQRWPVRRLSVTNSRQCLGYVYSPATITMEKI